MAYLDRRYESNNYLAFMTSVPSALNEISEQ